MRTAIGQGAVILCTLTIWGVVYADCIGGEGVFHISIKNQQSTYVANDVVECVTMGSISLGPMVTIPDNVVFNLMAPSVSVAHGVSVEAGSQLHIAARLRPINDTGILDCSSNDANNLPCPVVADSHPGQDAEYGRDFTHADNSGGHAGFSFTKLDANGDPLSANVANWFCVKDDVTGLIWEVKTNDAGLRDDNWTYTWYNPDSNTNGGDSGVHNGGICSHTDCDTQAYVQAVNTLGLCGASDWRLPSPEELATILSLDRTGLTVDASYFLNTLPTHYWTAESDAKDANAAWSIHFASGSSAEQDKNSSWVSLRLVRGAKALAGTTQAVDAQTCRESSFANTPEARFSIDGNEVEDHATGLICQRCSVGQTGDDCGGGHVQTYNWQGALNVAETERMATGNPWRLPNVKELRSIVERKCLEPAINLRIFPNTNSSVYWTASPRANSAFHAWDVRFDQGSSHGSYKVVNQYVRLVRNGNLTPVLSDVPYLKPM